MSRRTVQRRLNEQNLFGRIAAHKPFVSAKNKKARLQFAKTHLKWTVDDWKKVLWSDESKFNLSNTDGIRYVRRPSNARNDPKYTVGSIKHNGGNIMIWGCFSFDSIGPLYRIQGIMDHVEYKNILDQVMFPYAHQNMPRRWIFQQDNDPKHTAGPVKQWFTTKKIRVLGWPSQSPDLNPLENIWGAIERGLQGQKFSNSDKLFVAVEQQWKNLTPAYIETLIESMPRRCKAVIDAEGGPTKY